MASQFSKEVVQEARLLAIDEIIKAKDYTRLRQEVEKTINALTQGLQSFENNKFDARYKHNIHVRKISQIRNSLKKDKIFLAQLGLEGYYLVEKIKEMFAGRAFSYTLGAMVANKPQTLERRTNITLRQVVQSLAPQLQRSRSSAGANAILQGSISVKKLKNTFSQNNDLTDEQLILFIAMYNYSFNVLHQNNKGELFEAFESVLASQKNITQNYINSQAWVSALTSQRNRIPWYTFHGDVNQIEVKMNGFTLTAISTILVALEYMRKIFIALEKGDDVLAGKLKNAVFYGQDENAIASNVDEIINAIVDEELKNSLLNNST